jgi:dTDP-4-amino-4,6-dideoxygalactose transaminase
LDRTRYGKLDQFRCIVEPVGTFLFLIINLHRGVNFVTSRVRWQKNKPLPLIQVNPPNLCRTNKAIRVAYKNGNFSNSGEIHKETSRRLAKHVNSSFEGVLVNNNTLGLTAALLAIGVRDKHVLLSNFTFAATIQSVLLAGGIPLVCDVNKSSLEIDLLSVTRIIDSGKYNVAAVLPTRVLGYVNDFSNLVEFCKSRMIPVVIDAAAAFPSSSSNWEFSHQADYEVFSFHATKVFGIGEGGLIIGRPKGMDEVEKRVNFGFISEAKLEFTEGLNAKADEFTSARAKVRFRDYAKDVRARRRFASHYEDFFSSSCDVTFLRSDEKTIFAYFPIIFQDSKALVRFIDAVAPKITTRRYYFPTIFGGYRGSSQVVFDSNLDTSENISQKIVCLPVYSKYRTNVPCLIVRELNKALEAIS